MAARSTEAVPVGEQPPGRGGYPILWHSCPPFHPTGYGQQTGIFAPRLQSLGHRVIVSAYKGLYASPIPWDGVLVLPGGTERHGNDIITEHARHAFGDPKKGLTITLLDIWAMFPPVLQQLNVASWCPIDHEPAQEASVKALRKGDCVPIAMSRFGEQMLSSEFPDVLYVPHGIETDIYKPLERDEIRRGMGLADRFVVGVVAANAGQSPHRKAIAESITAFARFHATHPDAMLMLHTDMVGVNDGLDLFQLIRALKLPASSVTYSEPYLYNIGGFAHEDMARLYNAMDVLLMPSYGEGFGLPLVESQACGTPVIVNDFSSMPELLGAGWKVSGTPYWTNFGSWQQRPDVDEITDALGVAYERAGDLRGKAREFAVQYDADRVLTDHWEPALKVLGDLYDL
jgi:glycosyltransferase involved in cell wall biosynthesis